MAKISIPALVEGGKASAGPPLGPALGPLGVNIGQIISTINEKTKVFVGITVPVKVIVDKDTKKFEVEVGTPPVSALVKKELGLAEPVKEEAGVKGKKSIGNLSIDQLVKVANMKQDAMLAKSLRAAVTQVAGTCVSLGCSIEGKTAKEFLKDLESGKYDSKLKG